MTPQKPQKQLKLINFDPRWACRNIGGHGRIILVEYGPWGTLWDPSYDHFCDQCCSWNLPCWWNLPKILIWPSTGLIFGLSLLSSPREIRIWVYPLWRMDFLQICWFSIESEWNRWEVGNFSKKQQFGCRVAHPYSSTPIDLIHFFWRFALLSSIWLTLEAK